VSGEGCRLNRDLRFELDNRAATFCSLRRRSSSERSVAKLCPGSFLGNRTDRQDLNSTLGRVHACLYCYVPAVDPA
jgi:DNA repair photolyase